MTGTPYSTTLNIYEIVTFSTCAEEEGDNEEEQNWFKPVVPHVIIVLQASQQSKKMNFKATCLLYCWKNPSQTDQWIQRNNNEA